MEELEVIQTTDGRQFKPWANVDDIQRVIDLLGSAVLMTEDEYEPALAALEEVLV